MKKILTDSIEDGMVLGREVCGTNGNTLLTKGTVLTEAIGRRLQNWGIPTIFIEGEEEQEQEESMVTISPEELEGQLRIKFGDTITMPIMKKIFDVVYHYRLKNNK